MTGDLPADGGYPVFQAEPETVELRTPEFPPLLTGHEVDASGSALAHAVREAGAGRFSAGDFVWVRSETVFDVAVVLEPDLPRDHAMIAAYVAQVAYADCFGAVAPPEVGLTFGWPSTLRLNGARVGRIRIVLSETDDENGAPDWIVLGIHLTLKHEQYTIDPGLIPDETTFEEEGCAEIGCTDMIESFSRHMLTWFHTWEEDGFRAVHENYTFRADGYDDETTFHEGDEPVTGTFMGLDERGAALMKLADGSIRALDPMSVVEAPGDVLAEDPA